VRAAPLRGRGRARSSGLLICEGSIAARHHHDPDDSFVVKRQAHRKVALICHLASFPPASGLMRPGNDVAFNILEFRLRLLQSELLISARLLKHLPAGCDATKRAAWRHSFDVGIKQPFRPLEVMRGDSLDELTCAG
jgi:hypothetical protein